MSSSSPGIAAATFSAPSWMGVAVLGGLVLAIASSSAVDFRDRYRPLSIQPASAAFAIWAPIFAGVAVCGVTVLATPPAPPVGASASLAASLLACAAWTLAFSARRFEAAAACLFVAFAASAAALLLDDRFRLASSLHWARGLGPGLLCGWLALASALGVGIAWEEADEARRGGFSAWWFVPTSAVAVAVSLAQRTPFPSAAIAWGAALSPRSAASTSLLAASSVATAAAAVLAARE